MIPPAIAVKTPLIAGKPLAPEIPKHNGNAIKNTSKPETKSLFRFFISPAAFPTGGELSTVIVIFYVEVASFRSAKKQGENPASSAQRLYRNQYGSNTLKTQ